MAAERAALWLVRVYLAAYAFLTPNFRYVHREHSLISWGIWERAADLRTTGMSPLRATSRALREHAGELNPVALLAKTAIDAAHAPRDLTQLRWYPLRLGAIASVIFAVTLLAVDPFPEPPPPSGWSQPAGPPGSGIEQKHLGDFEPNTDLREAIYRVSGVCLERGITGWDLTDELVREGSPGADCSDLDRPGPPPDPA